MEYHEAYGSKFSSRASMYHSFEVTGQPLRAKI